MGGSPQISGGMTAPEQAKLLADERRFQDEQEERRRARALDEEKQREERDKLEQERLAQEEAQRIAGINKAEQDVIDESDANKSTKKASLSKVSFYTALGKGVVNKSEKPI